MYTWIYIHTYIYVNQVKVLSGTVDAIKTAIGSNLNSELQKKVFMHSYKSVYMHTLIA